jgi:molybdate transport system substrate-binding protein
MGMRAKCLGTGFVCGCLLLLSQAAAAEIMVFAAASLTDALKEIAPAFERKTGDRAVFNLGASSVLARQIQEGAPADLFFSADDEKMDGLEKQGLLGSRRSLLSNSLVIVVANDRAFSIKAPEDLLKARRIALAEPRTVPAGIYARKYLEQAGLWSKLSGSVVPTENVRAALSAVESGNVEAGIVYKTDAAISKRVKIAYEVPVQDGPKISYPVAVLKDSKRKGPAGEFLRYLESEEATKVFEKYGFIVVKPAEP